MSQNAVHLKLQTSSATVVVSLGLVLLMLGLAGWAMLNFKNLISLMKEEFGFQVILNENVSQANIEKLRKKLDASLFVKEAAFVSKDVAAEDMKKELGEDFISFLGENPIPSSINVKLNSDYANPDSLNWIILEIVELGEKTSDGKNNVKEVAYQQILFNEIGKNARTVGLVLLIFAFFLTIVAVGLINNTIRLSIYSKRFLLRTMYLVGATQGFIRKPFILRGIKQGIVAGIFASILLGAFIFVLIRVFPELTKTQDPNQLLLLILGVIILGVLISSLSSALSIRRYLRLKADDLHF